MHEALVLLILIEEGFALAQKTQVALAQNVAVEDKKPAHCGTLVPTENGGTFSSPNYPNSYPPNKECVYILEAHPRKRIQLVFDDIYHIEPSFECRFDNIEIRDGPFIFSPLINRFCGDKSPGIVTSSGRFLWIKFTSDEELEELGFKVEYSYTADPDFHLHVGGLLNPIPDCQFEMSGADGVIRSSQVEEENKVKAGEAVDCIWTIRAPPMSKIYLRFLDYQLENSNECKKNFVAIYEGSNAIEDLKAKFCSTVANDITLDNMVAVVRMWADETSKLSRFRLLFTVFTEPPCSPNAYFCHSNMCINNSLVCNGVQNCVFPWDENNCREKKPKTFFHQMSKTHGTVIGVSTGVVCLLLIISIFIQMKQPRKKILCRKGLFSAAEMQEVLDPPEYEMFSMQDANMPEELLEEELEGLQKLHRSASMSRCIREHHCGAHNSTTILMTRTNPLSEELSTAVGARSWGSFHGRRSSSRSHHPHTHAYSAQSLREALEEDELSLEGQVMEEIGYNEVFGRGRSVVTVRNHTNPVQQRSLSMDF
ncbi:neuropilin and tolloid-like protein 2 [Danio aesculapii]|uniref:neuropilin and tolloid-like protein 2 n=1 Tax=Danio aesculapii TaxID=1142201 RepID=UPI0024BF46D0|nr:neuropilin and tolloid-like protein 2 [Danio aesculapii]